MSLLQVSDICDDLKCMTSLSWTLNIDAVFLHRLYWTVWFPFCPQVLLASSKKEIMHGSAAGKPPQQLSNDIPGTWEFPRHRRTNEAGAPGKVQFYLCLGGARVMIDKLVTTVVLGCTGGASAWSRRLPSGKG